MTRWPDAGVALAEATTALRAGRPAGAALDRARRDLAGVAHGEVGLAPW
jgi:hypothetical protein